MLEVVQNNNCSDDLLEAGIVNLFSNSALLELNAIDLTVNLYLYPYSYLSFRTVLNINMVIDYC